MHCFQTRDEARCRLRALSDVRSLPATSSGVVRIAAIRFRERIDTNGLRIAVISLCSAIGRQQIRARTSLLTKSLADEWTVVSRICWASAADHVRSHRVIELLQESEFPFDVFYDL